MESDHIVVTHFINPSLFWYTDVPSESYAKIQELERELARFCKKDFDYHPPKLAEGEFCAVLYIPWNRYIRAEIKKITRLRFFDEYIMWAVDHGFPFRAKLEFLKTLPKEYRQNIDHIHRGGIINLVPAEKSFDFIKRCSVLKKLDKWNQRVCDFLEKTLEDTKQIVFKKQSENEQVIWGDLWLCDDTNQLSIREYLLNDASAIDSSKLFHANYKNATQIQPYHSNDGFPKFKSEAYGDELEALTYGPHEDAIRKVEEWCDSNELRKEEPKIPEALSKVLEKRESNDLCAIQNQDEQKHIKYLAESTGRTMNEKNFVPQFTDDLKDALESSIVKPAKILSNFDKNSNSEKENPDYHTIDQNEGQSNQAYDSNTKIKTKKQEQSLQIVPGGFDLARLTKYNNESNHWHRKLTTRFDNMQHESKQSYKTWSNTHQTAKNSMDRKSIGEDDIKILTASFHSSRLNTSIKENKQWRPLQTTRFNNESDKKSMSDNARAGKHNKPLPQKKYKSPNDKMHSTHEMFSTSIHSGPESQHYLNDERTKSTCLHLSTNAHQTNFDDGDHSVDKTRAYINKMKDLQSGVISSKMVPAGMDLSKRNNKKDRKNTSRD